MSLWNRLQSRVTWIPNPTGERFRFRWRFYCFKFSERHLTELVLVTCDKTRWCIKGHGRLRRIRVFHSRRAFHLHSTDRRGAQVVGFYFLRLEIYAFESNQNLRCDWNLWLAAVQGMKWQNAKMVFVAVEQYSKMETEYCTFFTSTNAAVVRFCVDDGARKSIENSDGDDDRAQI